MCLKVIKDTHLQPSENPYFANEKLHKRALLSGSNTDTFSKIFILNCSWKLQNLSLASFVCLKMMKPQNSNNCPVLTCYFLPANKFDIPILANESYAISIS